MDTPKKNNSSKSIESSIKTKKSKRLGIAKKEMKNFDISLEEFNSIKIDEFE